ncbi:hypothetical protein [Anatilimnocola floriformis]|uniref:hypothetical protein n=1 Tax=Anatilimnocola floriformis TaxID=2948575 RepID=UPI0020C52293|nr:hypothetical protein [Anatilimnocola floriformis]
MLKIADKASRFTADCVKRLDERNKVFQAEGGADTSISEFALTAEHSKIVGAVDSFKAIASDSIIIDISSLPKRFFFPIIRQLLKEPSSVFKNIVATYTIPDRYTDQKLAENFGDWAQLPLFAGAIAKEKPTQLIIGVGFEALGLLERVETSESGRKISFLLPFPAPIKAFQRSWELLRRLQEHQPPQSFGIFRVDVRDPSDAFDRLFSITNGGRIAADLAPFGPKPMSLAMCLFASLVDYPVFYTQPTVYHPDYSLGVSIKGGTPEIYAYSIRIDGKDLYAISP